MKSTIIQNSHKLFEVASGQGGYFTAQQALRAGYSKRLQHYHRKSGSWLKVDHGLFRLKNFPMGQWEDLIHWTLWSRNQKGQFPAVVSHASAAYFHELGDYLPTKIHLTVPVGFRKPTPKPCFLHKGRVPPKDAENHQGFRVTTPFRTLQDLGKMEGEQEHWIQAVKDAARRGLITLIQKKKLKVA